MEKQRVLFFIAQIEKTSILPNKRPSGKPPKRNSTDRTSSIMDLKEIQSLT